MPLNLEKVHDYQPVPGSAGVRLVKKTPYVRVVKGHIYSPDGKTILEPGQPPVICQAGVFYSDGGDKIKVEDVPEWFWEEARAMSKEGRANVGLVLPEEKKGKGKKSASSVERNLIKQTAAGTEEGA